MMDMSPPELVAGPSVPEHIELPPNWTVPVEESPLGRATVMLDAMDRYYAIAADSRRVRALPEVAERCTLLEEAMLSPDGTRIAVSGEVDVLVVDLTTGEHRVYPVEDAVDDAMMVTMLAWSPDGRLIACSVDGELVLLEVPGGRVRVVDLDGEDCGGAAFSPDASRLAVDLDEGVALVVFDVDGDVASMVALPTEEDEELSGSAAWSPDGRLVAVERARPDLNAEGGAEAELEEYAVTFIDVDGDEPVRSPHQVRLDGLEYLDIAGWRSSGAVVFLEHRPEGIDLVVRDLDGTELEVLALVSTDLFDVQLAPGLLHRLQTRTVGDDDAGPQPAWLSALSTATGGAAERVAGAVDRSRHRRRMRGD